MKRLVGITVLVGAILAPNPALAVHTTCSTQQDETVPVPSGVLVPDSHVRILVPPAYCDAGNSTAYPVLYLLHGAGDTWATWVDNTDVETFAANFDVIIVMPDAGHGNALGNEAGWYSDWVDGSRDWETFHTDVLVDWVDANYRTLEDPEHRALAGLSMGGFGALKYLARHPDVFSTAASFSGALDMMYGWPGSGPVFGLLHSQFGTPDDRVWGNQLTAAAVWREHNPADLARNGEFAGTTVLVTTGTGTPGGHAGEEPGNPGGYGLEQFIWQMNGDFAANLAIGGGSLNPGGGHPSAAPGPANWFYPGGLHSWPYWQSALHWALPELVEAID
ncbi:MAG: alpha/beta fold hydrolase [Actinobacteria bacterium]|nr:alpha/beta fold hydrolase [Actinomycetota bacterium]